ncbi:MAG: hypothetical protein ABI054_10115 [Planctomycetota bacterium]
MTSSRANDPNLGRTPALARLLERLSSRLTSQIWLFGLGTLAAASCAWLVFAFFADYALRVPRSVVWLSSFVAIATPLVCAWRFLVRPLRRRPDLAETAVLFERARPGSNDLFVSAVQLQQQAKPEGATALVDDVLARAEAAAASLDIVGVLDERRARWRALLGAGCVLALTGMALAFPQLARTFAHRMFDPSVRWPQRTHLTLKIALPPEKAKVVERDGQVFVRVARGSDLPIVVRAEGSSPDLVRLHVSGSDPLPISASSDGTYRTVLRALQQNVELRAEGGDDDGEFARASIEVLSPPDLAGLSLRIEPPAYTQRETRVEFDRDIEVLAGSKLTMVIRTAPADAKARARILPADTLQELTAMPYPVLDPNAPKLEGRGFEMEARESLRLRFELEDSNGLTNPDPGLFAVRVVADEKPQVSIYAPSKVEFDTLIGGWIALRARASDDFGISDLGWRSRASGDEAAPLLRPLEWHVLAALEREADETRSVVALGSVRVEVSGLGDATRPVVEGAQYSIDVQATDNRPEGGDGALSRSAAIAVHVLSAEEFLRRTQDRLARVRLSVGELETLAREKGRRARELVASLESDAPESGASSSELAALYSGSRRVEGDAQAIARELCSIAETVLYARLDSEADSALAALDANLAKAARSGAFPLEAWREFGRGADSGRGRATLAGQLAGLVDLSLTIDVDDALAAAKLAERAAQAGDVGEVHALLGEHQRLDAQLDGHIQELLARLAEWDNFQSILSLTKDILNRQKALRERAKAALGGK